MIFFSFLAHWHTSVTCVREVSKVRKLWTSTCRPTRWTGTSSRRSSPTPTAPSPWRCPRRTATSFAGKILSILTTFRHRTSRPWLTMTSISRTTAKARSASQSTISFSTRNPCQYKSSRYVKINLSLDFQSEIAAANDRSWKLWLFKCFPSINKRNNNVFFFFYKLYFLFTVNNNLF